MDLALDNCKKIMKVYINYSDYRFIKQQRFALTMAKYAGRFDKVIGYGRQDIDKKFNKRYKDILKQKKGGGFWLWKPFFINKTLKELSDGDYLFYSDSGAFFLKSVDVLIKKLYQANQDIMGFELPLIEDQWTKKELFINMRCTETQYRESNQISAAFILIKKTKMSENFFKEYLEYSCNEINITDKRSKEINQEDSLIAHRHDQSIFSVLYKKYNLRPFKDPSQFGKYPKGYLGGEVGIIVPGINRLRNGRKFRIPDYEEQYSSILFHHRNFGHSSVLLQYIKYRIKEILFKFGVYKKVL